LSAARRCDDGQITIRALFEILARKQRSGRGLRRVPISQGTLSVIATRWRPRSTASEIDGESRWGEVHPGYVERFGPEAATLGRPTQ
jgi:hypothetical protein